MVSLLLVGSALLVAAPERPNALAADLAEYEAARAKVGRDADAQVRLALWCEAHGLQAERVRHLALAVLTDPSHALARGLMGLVAYRGRWQRPDAVERKIKDDAALSAALSEYNARRDKAPRTADAHWRLALWCEEKGLKAEAAAHLAAVVRLDPGREAAWKRLGYKKAGGRWVTDEQLAREKAEAEAQKQADKTWKPLLTRWRGWLDERSKHAAAVEALSEVTDPRAVPAIWSAFITSGKGAHQEQAVQLLGRIDAVGASRALAVLSVSGRTPEVRRRATETLKRRDVREFADLLIALLRKPIKYQVRPVGGAGSPGVLFVEGRQFDVRRLYTSPAAPFIGLGPSDWVGTDAYGLPLIHRYAGAVERTKSWTERRIPGDQLLGMIRDNRLPNMPMYPGVDPSFMAALSSPAAGPVGAALSPLLQRQMFAPGSTEAQGLAGQILATAHNEHKKPSQIGFVPGYVAAREIQIPIGQMMAASQMAAASAQQRLNADVAALDAFNQGVQTANDQVVRILEDVSGASLGQDLEGWKAWWIDQLGYAYRTPEEPPKPTVVENVPFAAPSPGPVLVQSAVSSTFIRCSCFGAGTPVHTLSGIRPIESLAVGDQVLTQDTRTGALGYKPILVVHRNPPSGTYKIGLGGETIVSSYFHRFWKAGQGWVMARDLKTGDVVRTLGGLVPVGTIDEGSVQPVYNLDVAEDGDFFVGQQGALVHDNTLPDLRLAPFDAPPSLASTH